MDQDYKVYHVDEGEEARLRAQHQLEEARQHQLTIEFKRRQRNAPTGGAAGLFGRPALEALDGLMTLYHPNVPQGNFLRDVVRRGENRMLARVIVNLGLTTESEIRALYKQHDAEAYKHLTPIR